MRFLLSALVLLLAACGSLPVATDYAEEYDFSAVDSYVWMEQPATPPATDKLVYQSDLSHQRIVEAVDAELQAKGLEKLTEPRKGSLLVTYHRGVTDKVRVDSFYNWYEHFGYYPCYHCFHRPGFGYAYHPHDDFWVDEYQQDSLVIDLVDPVSKELVWRGNANRRLPELSSPEERRQYIAETIKEVMRHFPPGAVE